MKYLYYKLEAKQNLFPNIVKLFFDPSNKVLQIQDEKDFAFGVCQESSK
jgi:hypothetical protein